jgi:hypothetical protein
MNIGCIKTDFIEPVQKALDARRSEHPSVGVLVRTLSEDAQSQQRRWGFINRLLQRSFSWNIVQSSMN